MEPAKKETSNDSVTTEEVDEENLQVIETVKEEKEVNDCGTTEEVAVENVKDETARELTAEEVARKDEKDEQCDQTKDKIEKDISMEDDASKVDKNIIDETEVTDTLVKATEVTVVKEKSGNEATVIKEEPAIVTVHATAVIENSTSESLTQIEC